MSVTIELGLTKLTLIPVRWTGPEGSGVPSSSVRFGCASHAPAARLRMNEALIQIAKSSLVSPSRSIASSPAERAASTWPLPFALIQMPMRPEPPAHLYRTSPLPGIAVCTAAITSVKRSMPGSTGIASRQGKNCSATSGTETVGESGGARAPVGNGLMPTLLPPSRTLGLRSDGFTAS